MKRNLIAIFVLAAGGLFAQNRGGDGQPGNGQPAYDPQYDANYNSNYHAQGYVAQAPPPAPMYGPRYRRPPMPGPGFVWVNGYWSFMRGRYVWTPGYWTRPPFAGGYWVAPRYNRGHFFAGFWAGGPRGSVSFGYRR